MLVLDEPTAALDARSEFEVFERFAELTEGKMALFISHRFSTVRMADRIVVLAGGRIVEEGNHAQLVALGGTLRRDVRVAGCELSLIMIETNHRDVVQELPNPEPRLATTAEADREIAARGRELSRRLTWMPALKESDHFAKRFAAVSKVLDTVLASAEAYAG